MDVTLGRRWGANQPGHTVTIDQVQGEWLVQHGFGAEAQPAPAVATPAADPNPMKRAYRRSPATSTTSDQDSTTTEVDPAQVDGNEVTPKRHARRKVINTDS